MREYKHTHTAHGQSLFSRNGHVCSVGWMNSSLTDCVLTLILEQILEISWSLDNGIKEIEDMNLLTPDNNFLTFYPIHKAVSLVYVLLHHLQKFRRMRSHLWLSGISPNPRDFQHSQSRTRWPGLWTSGFNTQSARKILLILVHSGRIFAGFLCWAVGAVRLLTQSCSSLSGISQHQAYKLNDLQVAAAFCKIAFLHAKVWFTSHT